MAITYDKRRSMRAKAARVGAPRPEASARRTITQFLRQVVLGLFFTNLAIIAAIWIHAGGLTGLNSVAGLLTSAGRLTGLLGTYFLLLQLLLLARIPLLERAVGFDRLTLWHRVNGKLTLYFILAHVGLITAGYALASHISIARQFVLMLQTYPGMIQAAAATVLLLLVVATSIVMVRRRLRYEVWFLVHLMSYGAVALAWFHQLPNGIPFIGHSLASAYWIALSVVTMELIFMFRFVQPLMKGLWHRLRVSEVVHEGPGVVSLHITGKHLDWMSARAGQFFLWRFLTPGLWAEAHPFSLSAAPDGKSLRVTVKDLGDFSGNIANIRAGTPVVAEGPFGHFTDEARVRSHVLLVAGGVGITPIRALLEEMAADIVLIYRASSEAEIVFRDELDKLASRKRIKLHYLIGPRESGGTTLLSPAHLHQLVPDIRTRELYICGPSGLANYVKTSAKRAGVRNEHIHLDRFAF